MKVMEKVKGILRRKPKQLELEEYLEKLARKGLNPDGTPILDPVPLAPPIGYKRHPSMVEIVRDMVKSERLAQAARDAGAETLEEAEDFDIDDEYRLESPWENDFDPPLVELIEAGRQVVAERERQEADSKPPPDGQAKPADAVPPSDGPPPARD